MKYLEINYKKNEKVTLKDLLSFLNELGLLNIYNWCVAAYDELLGVDEISKLAIPIKSVCEDIFCVNYKELLKLSETNPHFMWISILAFPKDISKIEFKEGPYSEEAFVKGIQNPLAKIEIRAFDGVSWLIFLDESIFDAYKTKLTEKGIKVVEKK